MNLRAMHPSKAGLALVAAALAVAGCGHTQGAAIPRSQATDIILRLQEAQRRADAHACHDLRSDTIAVLEHQVRALPQNVDSNVRATLNDGVSYLNNLVRQECTAQTTTPTNTNTNTTPTIPTQTTTTPTATTTTTSTTTTPKPTPPKPTPATPTNTTTTPTTPGGVSPPGKGPGGNGPPGQQKKGKGGD